MTAMPFGRSERPRMKSNTSMTALFAGVTALLWAASAGAEKFDWRDSSPRLEMNVAFHHMAIACSAGFGFTRIPELPSATMVNKLHAYLLLRDDADADAQVRDWGEQ